MMKIIVNEETRVTSVVASAAELRESNTLAQNFSNMLARLFKSNAPAIEEDEEDADDEEEEE